MSGSLLWLKPNARKKITLKVIGIMTEEDLHTGRPKAFPAQWIKNVIDEYRKTISKKK